MQNINAFFLKIILPVLLVLLVGFLGWHYFLPKTPSPIVNQDHERLLKALPSDAPLAVKVKRKNDLEEAAQEAPYLEVRDCKPLPLIMKVVNKKSLNVKNSGEDQRTIRFNGKKYSVPAHGEIQIMLDFAKGELHPWYWYTCDTKSHTAGIVWIVFTYFLRPTLL